MAVHNYENSCLDAQLYQSQEEMLRVLMQKRQARKTSSLLPSAARTANASVTGLRNYDSQGLYALLTVTSASGTGGLYVALFAYNALTGNSFQLTAALTLRTANGSYAYLFHPSVTAALNHASTLNAAGVSLPAEFSIAVIHGDASSYTYQLDLQFVP